MEALESHSRVRITGTRLQDTEGLGILLHPGKTYTFAGFFDSAWNLSNPGEQGSRSM